jgi:hypothetical protein
MRRLEPPASTTNSKTLFLMGQDSHGNWVVRDQQCRCGGLFVDRAAALKFALYENGNQPRAVIMVPGILELAIDPASQPADNQNAHNMAGIRRAA